MENRDIEPSELWHLSFAMGWLDLGNSAEARAELGKLAPALMVNPDVLDFRWTIEAHEQAWGSALEVAQELIKQDPKRASGWLHRAYAIRRISEKGLPAAWDALLPAADQFPDEPIVPYNLSCYACQMGQLAEARDWLDRARKLAGKEKIKQMALADRDLEALWPEISKW